MPHFSEALKKARSAEPLGADDLAALIAASAPEEEAELFSAAREARARHFGDLVFMYGFIYLSTYCRNNCRFCSFRRESRMAVRYRKTEAEVLTAARDLSAQGVHLLDLTMGEDPRLLTPEGADWLVRLVEKVKVQSGRPVMISPGVVKARELRRLAAAGADWYACYQETHDRELYARLRPGQDYDERWQAKLTAGEMGLLVEDGLLCGVGETPGQLAKSLIGLAARPEFAQVRAMGFVPPPDSQWPAPPPDAARRELIMIAVMRLHMPERLIPASLDVDGLAGLADRLMAGANVVTSIIPRGLGLAGVAQATLDIDNENRSVPGIGPTLGRCGLRPAGLETYQTWINRVKGQKLSA